MCKRFKNSSFVKPSLQKANEERHLAVTLDEVIRFFKNPAQGFLKQGLNILKMVKYLMDIWSMKTQQKLKNQE